MTIDKLIDDVENVFREVRKDLILAKAYYGDPRGVDGLLLRAAVKLPDAQKLLIDAVRRPSADAGHPAGKSSV